MTALSFTLYGHVPVKKNRWHRARNGGIYFDQKGIKEQIESLEWQLKAVRNKISKPLTNVIMRAHFICRDNRGDLDGKLTTLLDCMVKMRLLQNDSLAHVKRLNVEGEKGEPERVHIRIVEVNSSEE